MQTWICAAPLIIYPGFGKEPILPLGTKTSPTALFCQVVGLDFLDSPEFIRTSLFVCFFNINTSTFKMTVGSRAGAVHSTSLASYPKWKALLSVYLGVIVTHHRGKRSAARWRRQITMCEFETWLRAWMGFSPLSFIVSLHHHLNHRSELTDFEKSWSASGGYLDKNKSMKRTVERCHPQHV